MITRWLRRFALAELVGGFIIFHAFYAGAQSQDLINERLKFMSENLQGRVSTIEAMDMGSRMRLLEADMSEVKWLGRTCAAAVASQLIIAGIAVKDRRRV